MLHEGGELVTPTNCVYSDASRTRSKGVAAKALQAMANAGYPLSSGLLALAGREEGSAEMEKARELEAEAESRVRRRGKRKMGTEGGGLLRGIIVRVADATAGVEEEDARGANGDATVACVGDDAAACQL
eukprot:1962693-Pleurochrysis_carterae.AAC.2